MDEHSRYSQSTVNYCILSEASPSLRHQKRYIEGRKARIIAVVFGAALLAVIFRIYDLNGKDLWLDEANSVIIAQQDLPQLVERLSLDSSPPLYYLLLHYWIKIFGDSVPAVRSLSVLFGVSLVACVFIVGTALFSLETGLIASLLMSVSPIQIFYSQQARMYTLLPALALLSVYFLWRAISDKTLRYLAAYVITTLLCLYVHNWAFHLLPAHFLMLLWFGELRARPLTWLLCGVCIFVGYLPWLPQLVIQLNNKTQYSWFLPLWQSWGPLGSFKMTLKSFTPGLGAATFGLEGIKSIRLLRLLPVIICLALVGLGIWKNSSIQRNGLRLTGPLTTILMFTFTPLASGFLASMVFMPHYVPGRVDQIVYPGFLLLLAVGLITIRSVAMRYGILLILLCYSAVGLAYHYGSQSINADRALASAIMKYAKPGDAVIFTSLTRASIQYYLAREKAPVKLFSYPIENELHLGNQDLDALFEKKEILLRQPSVLEHRIKKTCGPNARFFIAFVSRRPSLKLQDSGRRALTRVPNIVNVFLTDYLLEPHRSKLLTNIGEFKMSLTNEKVTLTLHQFL